MDSLLLNFLSDGALGDLKIDMDADDAQSILGAYEDIGYIDKTHFILKYNDLQLTFNKDGKLKLICIYSHDGKARLPESLALEGDNMQVGNLKSVRDELDARSIPARIDTSLTFEGQSCLDVGPGVKVIHGQPEDEIDTIQFSGR